MLKLSTSMVVFDCCLVDCSGMNRPATPTLLPGLLWFDEIVLFREQQAIIAINALPTNDHLFVRFMIQHDRSKHDRSKWRRNVNVMKRKSNPI